MTLGFVLASVASWLSSAIQEAESPLGKKVVQMRNVAYYKNPKTPRQPADPSIGKPKYGDPVTVVAVEGNYSRVQLSGGAEAWIFSGALIAVEKFDPNPESEEEKTRLNAVNYKSGRFDSTTEAAYIKEKGPAMDGAYKNLDKMMAQPEAKTDRAKLEAELAAFRKTGKMGEFASVK